MSADYSGTPLVRKLGIDPGCRLLAIGPPPHYGALLGPLPEGARPAEPDDPEVEVVHFFARTIDEAVEGFRAGLERLRADGAVWASWPKKASGVPSELDGNRVRALGLARGLVDVKVCAVDETWSALKFVIPRAKRARDTRRPRASPA